MPWFVRSGTGCQALRGVLDSSGILGKGSELVGSGRSRYPPSYGPEFAQVCMGRGACSPLRSAGSGSLLPP